MMRAFIRSGRWVLGAGGLLAALTAYGCAPTAETQQLQTGESNIRGMVASDRQQIEALQEKIARLDDRISELEHNGGESDNKTIGALNARLSKLESQMRGTQPAAGAAPGTPGAAPPATPGTSVPGAPGAPPAPGAASASPPPDNSNSAGDVGEDTSGDANGGSEVASTTPPAAAAPLAAPPPAVSAAQSWQALLDQEIAAAQSSRDPAAKSYRQGLAAMKAGQYPLALGKFQDLQRRYPKSALSEPAEYFSANALYELGESNNRSGNHDRATENFNKAILQFNDLVMRFPSGRFASPSLLREAQAFVNIEDRIDARLTLQKLLNDHGNSAEAPTAKSMMQSLASE
jgi:TolA-binding protein